MADITDPELEYLSPSFDPASLTVPRLRSILVAHDVRYPSSAKKADLIDIFTQNVTPKAKRILSARSRVKRSARGIEDIPSSHEPSVDGEESEEHEEATSPPDTVKRSSKRVVRGSKVAALDGTQDQDPPTARKVGRVSSVRQSRMSDVEVVPEREAPRSPSSRTRKSIATPAIKQEEEEDARITRRGNDNSPFTAENPFQSGSSPLAGVTRGISGERRRRTMGAPSSKTETVRSSSRRKTDFPIPERLINDSAAPPPKRTDQALTRNKRTQEESSETEDAGEEFTPEGQLEVAEARAQHGELARRPAKRRKSSQKSNGVAKIAPWAVSLAMLGGLATVWRQEKIEVGFCGVGRPSTSLAGVKIPEWASVLQPECEPCPPHAYCYSGLQVSCEPDFVLVPHPFSLGGLVPLPPTCEPDGEKAQKVKAVADRAVEELRERNAKWECGELKNEVGKKQAVPEMKEPELKQAVSSKKRKGMSQEEFEELWAAALGEITNRDEIESGVDGTSGPATLRSTSLAHISLPCALRRSLRLTLARHLHQLVLLVLALASALYARTAIASRRETEAKAKKLAVLALERLALQAARGDEAWISMAQLRDDVLRDEFKETRRRKLWEKVQKKVEGNANVRSMVREGRSGEVSRVWEWIGAVGALEDGSTVGGGGSGRSARFESPRALVKGEGEWDAASRRRESGVVDDGRPIY